MYKRLYIMVEGNDDERFFREIINPLVEENYDHIIIWQYAQKKNQKIDKFIKSINSMGADYFFVGDLDAKNCVIEKKKEIEQKLNTISRNRIIVVIKEIESWYLAGLDRKTSEKLGISNYKKTNNIFKEEFNNLFYDKYDSRIDLMQEIMKEFSLKTATLKNKSFKYFLGKITE